MKFALGGAVLVTVTYAGDLEHGVPEDRPGIRRAVQCGEKSGDAGLLAKCAAVFQAGVKAGARAQRDATLNHLLVYSLIALVAVSAVAALAGWLLAGHILRPVHQLTAPLSRPAPTREELIAMGVDVRPAVDHAEALIATLLTLARNERGLTTRQSVDLAALAEDALDTAASRTARANLVDNAGRYNVPDGLVSVGTSAHNGTAEFHITNTGPVVPADRVDALFEPFTRLDERTARASGWAFALVASIRAIHHATISAAPAPEAGSTSRCASRTDPRYPRGGSVAGGRISASRQPPPAAARQVRLRS